MDMAGRAHGVFRQGNGIFICNLASGCFGRNVTDFGNEGLALHGGREGGEREAGMEAGRLLCYCVWYESVRPDKGCR